MKPSTLFFATILLLTVHRTAVAQVYRYGSGGTSTTISVSDKQTEEPLLGATISIISRADTLQGTTTKNYSFYSRAACFRCDRIFRDSVSLKVEYMGYVPFEKRYAPAEFAQYIDVRLEVDPQAIAQVVVVGKQVAMVFRGDTTVYNAGAFKTMTDDKFGELLRQLPGVEIKEGKIYANGEAVKRVLIDGRNLFGQKSEAALTDLDAKDVKRVSVYEEQSATDKRMGNDTAPKETVMNVETKSKRGVLLGGELSAMAGVSLEEDYSGRNEVRHAERLRLFRHSEKGSISLSGRNSKDESSGGKITPSKRFDANLAHEYRNGDSTMILTFAEVSHERGSSESRSLNDYFPTTDYAVRNNESSNSSRSKQLNLSLSQYTMIERGKNSFSTSLSGTFGNGSGRGLSATRQQIDEDITQTRIHSDNTTQNYDVNLGVSYSRKLTERGSLSVSANTSYQKNNARGWQIDTTASTPGLQLELRNKAHSERFNASISAGYRHRIGKKGAVVAQYEFQRTRGSSEQLSVDFRDDPRGMIDTTNTYEYTTDNYTHSISGFYSYNREDAIRLYAGLTGEATQIARNERFPDKNRYPRTFYQLNPSLRLTIGKPQSRLSIYAASNTSSISIESLRSTLDATNPLSLRAGNPDLKQATSTTWSMSYSRRNAKRASDFSVGFNGGYTFNYVAARRYLYLQETYLPQYDYTAQKGAQLNTQTNTSGSYRLGGNINYSQQISALRSTASIAVNYGFSQTPYYSNDDLLFSHSHSLGMVLQFNTGFSEKVRINLSSSTSLSRYNTLHSSADDLNQTLQGGINLRFGKYFGNIDTRYRFYCNSRSRALTRHDVGLNFEVGRKYGKENRLSTSIGAIDILNRPDYASTSFDTDYIRTSATSYLGRYLYLRVAYTF